ncbi:MAG: IS1634 family transposase [Mycobacterium sp.]
MPYVKTSSRTTSSGVVRYLQLAHNEWDSGTQRSRTRVLYNFGREDELDREAIQRLVTSLSRLLEPGAALQATARTGWEFISSVPLGGAYVLDGLWRRLGIDAVIRGCVAGRRLDGPALERILFALVASRALAPSSKLAAAGWVGADVHIDGLEAVSDDACYRAMDELHAMEDDFGKKVYDNLANLLNLEVDLLFFDTTSTYFETEQADEALPRDENGRHAGTGGEAADAAGFRSYGKSKDSRPDLPQVIVGMAVTRDGIPVRCWCWPGNTGDQALIRQARDDMREWTLARIIWVGDRGFSSKENRRHLMRAGGAYILGEKLRSAAPDIQAALARQGRYRQVAENMHVKEVRLGDASDRMVICYNPEAAVRDAAVRGQLLTQLTGMIEGTDTLSATDRARLSGVISAKDGLKKFLKTTTSGLLRIDTTRIKAEQRLDGKFLLRCGDARISAEDIALGYKQLLEVERGWRDMKQIIDLRPVYHHLEDRIRAHVTLCWLALLLIRITETTTGQTWNHLRADLQRIHLGTFAGDHGTFTHRTQLTASHKHILKALDLAEPPLVIAAAPATP